MAGCRRRGGGIFMALFGLLFVTLGIGLGIFGSRAAIEAADRAERLPLATARVIERGAAGGEVVVEGRISTRNPQRFREFVAYVREEYRGTDSDGDPKWHEDERVTPPLVLELPDGLVQIENDNYRLESPPLRWQDSTSLSWNGLTGEGTRRYSGFAAGATVMAIGPIVQGREGPALQAEFLSSGDRAAYVAQQRSSAAAFPIVGLIFGGIGALFALVGLWQVLRG
ncbi:MAG: hypothetical protein HXY39_01105 [Chloroflexi bacterium]|nr:hypothetical protein [Chloroflexota bacterium]